MIKTLESGASTFVFHDEIQLGAEVDSCGWATFGYPFSDNSRVLVDGDEWPHFVELVAKVDELMKARK